MEANELMIGDWVKVDQTTETVKAKVLGVHKDGVINYEVDYSGIRATNQIHTDYVSPIKLTEEILVKNGFKKESQTIDGDYCKYTLPRFVLNWCDTDGFWYQNGDITPNHVHTLQHLLRLCGIEKELIID